MKALLANIDLMVRVVVPDDATEEQIISAIVDRCQELSSDRSWFGEGVSEINDDEVMPYGSSLNDGIIGYQIESADGKHEIPDEFYSFEIFTTAKEADAWLAKNNIDNQWKSVPVADGDIEGVTYIGEDVTE